MAVGSCAGSDKGSILIARRAQQSQQQQQQQGFKAHRAQQLEQQQKEGHGSDSMQGTVARTAASGSGAERAAQHSSR